MKAKSPRKLAWERNDEAVVHAVADVLGDEVFPQLEALRKRVEQLEATHMKYVGVWKQGTPYREGNFVTYKGAMWACRADNESATPGKSPAWQLAVKSGRDGKDSSR
jgi:hypothetical protein